MSFQSEDRITIPVLVILKAIQEVHCSTKEQEIKASMQDNIMLPFLKSLYKIII